MYFLGDLAVLNAIVEEAAIALAEQNPTPPDDTPPDDDQREDNDQP